MSKEFDACLKVSTSSTFVNQISSVKSGKLFSCIKNNSNIKLHFNNASLTYSMLSLNRISPKNVLDKYTM